MPAPAPSAPGLLRRTLLAQGLAASALAAAPALARDIALLNVSCDPTRAFYADANKAFAAHWKARTGDTVTIRQSHGGSGKRHAR